MLARDVDRLSRFRLRPQKKLTNRSRGEHLAGKGGSSIDFCDYRDYAPGDDLRFLDWNILARTNRAYVKQYHLEEEIHVAVLIDASESMNHEGKLELAVELAAGFAMMALHAGEKCSVEALSESGPRSKQIFRTGRSSVPALFRFLGGIPAGGATPVEAGIEHFLRWHTGRGIVVVLSDFLTGGDIRRGMNLLHSAGLEPLVIQILSPWELAPELAGDLRLADSETGAVLDISASGALMEIYKEQRERLTESVGTLACERGGRFHVTASDQPPMPLFAETFRKLGWIR